MGYIIESELEPVGEAQVEFLDEPPTHEGDIHARRPLPIVPDGEIILHGVPELN